MKMKFINMILAAGILTVASSCVEENLDIQTPPVQENDGIQDKMSGQVILKFDDSLSDLLDRIDLTGGPATRSGVNTVDEILEIIGGYKLERVFPVNKATEDQSREAGLHLWYVVYFDESQNVRRTAPKMKKRRT